MQPSRFTRILAVASAATAVGLILGWLMLRFSGRPLMLPCYDTLVAPAHPQLLAVLGVYVVLLLVTSWALVKRKSFAPWLFIGAGWLGLFNTALMLWPRQGIRSIAQFGLSAAKKTGKLPRDAGIWELIQLGVPASTLKLLIAVALVFVIVWLVLLIAGTKHLLSRRPA
jgi:hypothetical protein